VLFMNLKGEGQGKYGSGWKREVEIPIETAGLAPGGLPPVPRGSLTLFNSLFSGSSRKRGQAVLRSDS